MRVFVGIPIPDMVRKDIESIVLNLRPHVLKGRYTTMDNLHLTLIFIGEINQDDIQSLCQVLESSFIDERKFDLRLGHLGTFEKGTQSIVWLGISQGKDNLYRLSNHIREKLLENHIEFDQKGFNPHITLIRQAVLKDDHELSHLEEHPRWTVDRIHLYLSHQVDGILTYDPIHTIHIK